MAVRDVAKWQCSKTGCRDHHHRCTHLDILLTSHHHRCTHPGKCGECSPQVPRCGSRRRCGTCRMHCFVGGHGPLRCTEALCSLVCITHRLFLTANRVCSPWLHPAHTVGPRCTMHMQCCMAIPWYATHKVGSN